MKNPILESLRQARERGDDYTQAADWLTNLSDMAAGSEAWNATEEQVEFATRVLERLVEFEDTECVAGHYGSRVSACNRAGVRRVAGFWYCDEHARQIEAALAEEEHSD